MKVLILNGPDPNPDSVTVRTGDRWPSRKPRKVFKGTVIHPYPVWLSYCAAVLKQGGFETQWLDAIYERLDVDQTIEKIQELAPAMVVVDVATPTIKIDLETTRRIKDALGIPTVLVDCHATVFHEDLIKEPYVDYVARGEFELTVLEIAECIRDGGNPKDILGITYKEDGQVVVNEDRPLVHDLDSLPFPDRDLIDQRHYRQELCMHEPYFQMIGSRGCPFHCIFCLWVPVLFKKKVRLRKVETIVDEIAHLQERYGAREVFFYDDTVNISVKRVIDLSNEIIKRGIKIAWVANMRVDQCSEEMLRVAKQSGCRQIIFGIETGSQWMMDNVVNKKITLDQARDAVRWAKKTKILAHCDFVVGLPGETRETLDETRRFIKSLQPDAFQVGLATPYPGTTFYDMVKDKIASDWEKFDGSMGESFCELSRQELMDFIHRMYLEYYLTPRQIWKRLLSLRTWDGIKANWKQVKSFIGRYSTYFLSKMSRAAKENETAAEHA